MVATRSRRVALQWIRTTWLSTAGLLALSASGLAAAGEAPRYQFDIASENLSDALRDVAVISRSDVIAATQDTTGKSSAPLHGTFTLAEALDRLLAGSGLHAETSGDGFIIRPGDAGNGPSDDIVVTGSRIGGAPVTSLGVTIDRTAMLDQGYSDLGGVVRSIPQSFGGGQNPGVGFNVPSNSGVDIGGGASIDLRGLGSDATLTLLDGHRVAYSASRQSIDVSAIPIGVVDHIDIVPDGASALYGSDAVAGVANVVLRRDMKGVEIDARLGGSTDGGNFQQQYSAAAGNRWATGGFIVAYDYGSSSAIWGRQRSYAPAASADLTLMPELSHNSGAFNGHQALTDRLTLEIDAYYNSRIEKTYYPELSQIDGLGTHDQVYGIAPVLKWDLGAGWHINLQGTVGREHVDLTDGSCTDGQCTWQPNGYYDNKAHSVEVNGNGKLVDLPAGPLKLAIGGGYQHVEFINYFSPGSPYNTDNSRNNYYAFGELAIPLVSPAQGIAFVDKLSASAAVRYERYPGIANVATPKLGLLYAPVRDIDIKASWGKSFRAPTLYEQYSARGTYLYPATGVGASGLPDAASVLLQVGGSPDLKPERATTWSTGITYHPGAVPGAKLEVSYFHINYRDRIVAPITTLAQALSNPIYSADIVEAPSTAAQAAALASGGTFINATSYAYNPANVIAIVDDLNVNAGHQWVQGIDILADYAATVGEHDQLHLSGDVTYLESKQQLSASQPVLALAGTIFNPPHWRGKANLDWKHEALAVDLAGNVTGGVIDNRATTPTAVSGMATMDMTLRYALRPLFGHLAQTVLTFSVQNLFNAKPTAIAIAASTDTPYDSTNYTPIGRFVSFGVSAKW